MTNKQTKALEKRFTEWFVSSSQDDQFLIHDYIDVQLAKQKKEFVKHLKEKFTQGFHEVEISYEDLDQAIKTFNEKT